jgi:hypothetical protein
VGFTAATSDPPTITQRSTGSLDRRRKLRVLSPSGVLTRVKSCVQDWQRDVQSFFSPVGDFFSDTYAHLTGTRAAATPALELVAAGETGAWVSVFDHHTQPCVASPCIPVLLSPPPAPETAAEISDYWGADFVKEAMAESSPPPALGSDVLELPDIVAAFSATFSPMWAMEQVMPSQTLLTQGITPEQLERLVALPPALGSDVQVRPALNV